MKSQKTHSDKSAKSAIYFHPTSTVSQSRLPIFASVTRVAPQKAGNKGADITFDTSFGQCTVKNCRLTQVHRDIIDAIMSHHEKIYKPGNGDVAYGVNAYQILKSLGYSNLGDVKWLRNKLEEMRLTSIIAHEAEWTIHTGIIVRHGYSSNRVMPKSKNGKVLPSQGELLYVQFSAEFLRAFGIESNVHYPLLVDKICQIDCALVKATVRFFMTHRGNYNIGLYKVLKSLGIRKEDMSERTFRAKIQELRDSKTILEEYGIYLNDEMFSYPNQHGLVWFTDPELLAECPTESESCG